MEPEVPPPAPNAVPTEDAANDPLSDFPALAGAVRPAVPLGPPEPGSVEWFFLGANGLRAGWSIAIFLPLLSIFASIAGALLFLTHLVGRNADSSRNASFWGELAMVIGMAAAAAIVAFIEQRRLNLLEYNLIDSRRWRHLLVGSVAGFAALSLLVGLLKMGGWLTFAPSGLALPALLRCAAFWAAMFLLVGLFEEGTFRCYLQATLSRGLNLWWALGIQTAACAGLFAFSKGNGVWSVYLMAVLGLPPCLWLALRKAHSAGFWLAAWVTSTLFGVLHTGNNGENWIGIFAVTAIGFVFVVSVRVTGSAWWAIGFHAAWDWAETYFYGTANSGMQAKDSLMISRPAGNVFWSGGTDGPEGSILVLGVILITLACLLLAYGRNRAAGDPASQIQA